jgi:hypothetical protein
VRWGFCFEGEIPSFLSIRNRKKKNKTGEMQEGNRMKWKNKKNKAEQKKTTEPK